MPDPSQCQVQVQSRPPPGRGRRLATLISESVPGQRTLRHAQRKKRGAVIKVKITVGMRSSRTMLGLATASMTGIMLTFLYWDQSLMLGKLEQRVLSLRSQLQATAQNLSTQVSSSQVMLQNLHFELKNARQNISFLMSLKSVGISAPKSCSKNLPKHVNLLQATDIVRVKKIFFLLERSDIAAFQVEEHVNCVKAGLLTEGHRFNMCIHNQHEDIHVSGSIMRDGVWEGHVLRRFVRILQRFPKAAVIDVGAQLGMYGLEAAMMNRRVRTRPNFPMQRHKSHRITGSASCTRYRSDK